MKVQIDLAKKTVFFAPNDEDIKRNIQIGNNYLEHLRFLSYSFNTIRLKAYENAQFLVFLNEKNLDLVGSDPKIVQTYYEHLACKSTLCKESIYKYLITVVDLYEYLYYQSTENNYKLSDLRELRFYFRKITKVTSKRKKHPVVLDNHSFYKLFEACGGVRNKLLLLLLLETGMRISEALSLYVSDVDFGEATITIYDRGFLENGASIKTANSVRSIYCSSMLMNALSVYFDSYPDLVTDNSHLFIKVQGKHAYEPMSYKDVNNLFARIRKKTGVYVTPHMLRHTSLTNLYNHGWSLELLAARAGHKSVSTTANYYIHTSDESLYDAFISSADNLSHFYNHIIQ